MFSDPVVGENFFGRKAIIDLLVKRADGLKSGYRQNVAIIGHQQLGKTSILRHFLHIYTDPQILSIYVEIKFQALDYFIDQFARSLLYQFLKATGVVDPGHSLSELVQKTSPSIPRTLKRIEEIMALLKQRHADEAYSKLFELTSVIREETGKHCIVILDEFHRLGEFGIKNAFSDFGKRIMVQKDTMYLLSSSSFSASRKILAEKLSLLFGNFERIYLEPFDFATSFKFIEKKLSPLAIEDSLNHFLVAFTDGQPFFLDSLSTRIKECALAKSEDTVSKEIVALVFHRLLYESQGVLNQFFLKTLSPWTHARTRGSQVLILVQIAKGNNKLQDIARGINRSQKETCRQIEELVEHELILKTGVFYRFHNKIFKFWLREVYEKKELSLSRETGDRDNFKTDVIQRVQEHEELLKISAADRVIKLFGLFKNETVELGEKRKKLPHFTEFIRLDGPQPLLKGSSRKLIARGGGRCWVCKIIEEKASEKEVLDLVMTEPPGKKTAATKVLVALNGFDENARLLSKEKKILTLGLSKINMLLDIYDHSPIVYKQETACQ